MPLETAGFVNQLDSDNPLPTDLKQQGDDHLRLIKAVLLATFPNMDAALLKTPAFLNALGGQKMGAWPETTMRAAVGDLNSQTEAGWYRFTTGNGNNPGMNGFLLILSTDGDLATPQGGRTVMQIAFSRWESTFGQNFAGNVGGFSCRVNVNGGGYTPWAPDFNDTDPIGTSEMFWTTNVGLSRGSVIDNPLRLHGMGEPVAPGAFFASAGTWYVVCGAGRVVQTFPGPQNWYNYIARRIR